ncbi:hypothetical protein FB446DRAFT_705948 [Lentinula raphanica]|nr:hypothetical protein FB446DRAFT_705948 [Lentinula raphanica]
MFDLLGLCILLRVPFDVGNRPRQAFKIFAVQFLRVIGSFTGGSCHQSRQRRHLAHLGRKGWIISVRDRHGGQELEMKWDRVCGLVVESGTVPDNGVDDKWYKWEKCWGRRRGVLMISENLFWIDSILSGTETLNGYTDITLDEGGRRMARFVSQIPVVDYPFLVWPAHSCIIDSTLSLWRTLLSNGKDDDELEIVNKLLNEDPSPIDCQMEGKRRWLEEENLGIEVDLSLKAENGYEGG